MHWNYRKIRKTAWDTAYNKGFHAWLLLVAVGFIFAFIGAANSSSLAFIDITDKLLGTRDTLSADDIDILKKYATTSPIVKKIPFITSDMALSVIDSILSSTTWLIKVLAVNVSYVRRNPGEVVANMILAAIFTAFIKFFIQNVVIIGRNRYVMENRFSKDVPLRRIVAPFHKEYLKNITFTMFLYHITIYLWSLTVIGGIYKSYQYSMVPYILAENPTVGFREAKKLSKAMTKGYKIKMLLTQLSFIHIWLLKLVPVAGLFIAVPLESQLGAEMYFTLRDNPNIDNSLFIEKNFSIPAYVESKEISKTYDRSNYLLRDPEIKMPNKSGIFFRYSFADVVFIFFIFSNMGWVWEVGHHFMKHHTIVNRGTMYGPWIPIYGVGGVLVILLLDRFKSSKLKLFTMTVLLCAVLEYITSLILDFLFNTSYWNYKKMFLNINGRICLAGLAAFGLGGLFGTYVVAPMVDAFSKKHSKKQQAIACCFLCTLFIIDFILCLIFGFNSGSGVGGHMA